jgi:N4-gp56 family major capsid protein
MPQGTTGTVALSPEVKAMYDADFYLQGQSMVYWDQFADLKGPIMNGQRGISQNFPIIENLPPNFTVLDELIDVSPNQMRGSEVVVTLSEFGGAIEVTKFLVATAYADVYKQAAYVNGYNLAESVDYIARAVFGQGSRVWFQGAHTARNQFAGQTATGDQMTIRFLEMMAMIARSIKMPLYEDGAIASEVHPFVLYDLMQDQTNGGLRTMSQYSHPEILFNGEIAYWGGNRLIVSANAKGFWGAGAPPTTAVATTLAAPINPGDSQITVTSATGIAIGMWLAIDDAAEPGNVWTDTNELFRVTGIAGTTITGFVLDPGPGDAGGFRWPHATTGTTVSNNNSVYPVPMFGPNSVTKAASSWTGPYGETVVTGPFDRLGRFLTFGWYLISGYARTRNAWLFRGEVGSSQS